MKKQNKQLLKLLKNHYFWISLIFLLFGIAVNQISSVYLKIKYKDSLPILNDLLLDNLPFYKIAWLYDIFVIFPVLIFLIYVYYKKTPQIPYLLVVFGISQLLRGIFIVLTPFGSPFGNYVGLFDSTWMRSGVYPSGHVATAFLTFLLTQSKLKWLNLAFTIGIIITLLLTRGHYSIDIFSALIFSYAVFKFSETSLKSKLLP